MKKTKTKTTKPAVELNDAEKKLARQILCDIWSEIGGDILSINGEMKRDEVVEVVLDADRPSEEAERAERRATAKKETAKAEMAANVLRFFRDASYDEKKALARSTFTHGTYWM